MNHLLIVDDSPVDIELARQLVLRHTSLQVEFANNGLDAIEHLESPTPLAVLTDLRMPELDGLALVREMRRRFPTIPVILMTAHGNEDIALEALVVGAADYIPKHRLAADLPRILTSVLGVPSGDQRHDVVTRHLRYKQLRYTIESEVSLIPVLVDQLQQAAVDLGVVGRSENVRLARCLSEALHNAVVHGCAMKDSLPSSDSPALTVDVYAEFTREEARYRIRDHGRGFNPDTVLDPRKTPAHLTADSGRGLALMRLFMDEVTFNDRGNEVTLVKRKPLIMI